MTDFSGERAAGDGKAPKSRKILDVRVDFGLSGDEAIEKIDEIIAESESGYAVTTNPEFVMEAQSDPEFMKLLNGSDLSLPDGSGLLFADCYLGKIDNVEKNRLYPLKALLLGIGCGLSSFVGTGAGGISVGGFGGRITGADLITEICGLAERKGYSVLFVGGWERDFFGRGLASDTFIARRTSDAMKIKYPRLMTLGGISEFSYKEEDDGLWLEEIRKKMDEKNVDKIDVVFVAFGHVKQEKWISRNLRKIPAKFGIGVGASFDFIVGVQKRAPEYLIKLNLEWLFRLVTQPWRVRRVLKAFPLFPIAVFLDTLKK